MVREVRLSRNLIDDKSPARFLILERRLTPDQRNARRSLCLERGDSAQVMRFLNPSEVVESDFVNTTSPVNLVAVEPA